MTDSSNYTPPKVWEYEANNMSTFSKTNRPIAGSTHEKMLPVGKHPLQLYSLATPNGVKVTILLEELIELGEAENDSQIVLESEELLRDLAKTTNKLKLEAMLSGEADSNDCFVEIHAGAGGTESQDWASMLRRLYLRWAENRGFEVELVEESLGEEAGI